MDVCRQSIFLDCIEDVTACLETIRMDSDVDIVRVKNRLRPDMNSSDSAGYRNVAINLRFRTLQSIQLGLCGHVCEVQLVLRSIAQLQVNKCHHFSCNPFKDLTRNINQLIPILFGRVAMVTRDMSFSAICGVSKSTFLLHSKF